MSADTLAIDSISGSYQKYKEDTTVFCTWLNKTAVVCGYDAPQPVTPSNSQPTNTKSRAERRQADREKAKAEGKKVDKGNPPVLVTTKHVVRTQEILRQAEKICQSGKFPVPHAIGQVLDRAIMARKRCSEWFQTNKADNGHSTEGHLHFISILEKALEILTPLFDPKTTKSKDRGYHDHQNSSADLEKAFIATSNRFEGLAIQDPKDILEDLIAPVRISSNPHGDKLC